MTLHVVKLKLYLCNYEVIDFLNIIQSVNPIYVEDKNTAYGMHVTHRSICKFEKLTLTSHLKYD